MSVILGEVMLGMKSFRLFGLAALGALTLSAAQAQIIFSNVSIVGSLVSGASYATGPNYIDFYFPNASVGDSLPDRVGSILITYDAAAPAPMVSDFLVLNVLGALSGSGTIFLNEVIEDLADPQNPTVIGSHNAVLDENSQLPYSHTILFDYGSDKIRVKKTFTLSAVDSQAFDLASVGLVQQTISIVPEPGSLMALGLGAVALASRRKRNR